MYIYLLLGCPGMSQDILGHNKMRWTWDCLDIQQLTGMSWDIPGCPSWDCIPLVRMFRDILGHNRMRWTWDSEGYSLIRAGCVHISSSALRNRNLKGFLFHLATLINSTEPSWPIVCPESYPERYSCDVTFISWKIQMT